MNSNIVLGKRGEDLAVEFLQKKGLQILERNWRCMYGELDIVAKDGEVLVFVEVKTRSSVSCGHPLESLNAKKILRLRRLGNLWTMKHNSFSAIWRIDLVAIVLSENNVVDIEYLQEVA